MEYEKFNLFILADNALVVNGLKHYLESRFGDTLSIYNFYNTRSCLKNINKDTKLVVLDYFLKGTNRGDVIKAIKEINPEITIVMHSSNDEVASSIKLFQRGQTVMLTDKYFMGLDNRLN